MPTAAAIRAELTDKVHKLTHISTEPSVKGRLNALARHLKMPAGRVAKYWYGLIPCPPAHEADMIRAYYDAAQKLIQARQEYEDMRTDFLRNYPSMARIAPGSLQDTALSNEALVATNFKKKRAAA